MSMISSLAQRSLRVIRERGLGSLFREMRRRIGMLENNLRNNENFSNPFYVLLNYLSVLNERSKNIAVVTCSDYENYFNEHRAINDFPFEIEFDPVGEKEDIVAFINEFDCAYARRMIQNVFISLIGFLQEERGSISLLDFGTGPSCGMYGENGRFLFDIGKVNTKGVGFFAIDDHFRPQGAIFEKSTYAQCDILFFNPAEKFDLITGHHVLEHCNNWQDVMIHISHLLKKGGYLYLSFPALGGFYDTAYRLMSPLDHCANFDINMLRKFSKTVGLEMCLVDTYVDPNSRFNWICNLYPGVVNKEMADYFYDLCVNLDSKLLLGFHNYGHYVVLKKFADPR